MFAFFRDSATIFRVIVEFFKDEAPFFERWLFNLLEHRHRTCHMLRVYSLIFFLICHTQLTFGFSSRQDSVLVQKAIIQYEHNEISKDSLIQVYVAVAGEAQASHNFRESRKLLDQAESLLSNDTTVAYAKIARSRAMMAMEEDDRAEAIELLVNALEIFQLNQDSLDYLETLRLIGVNYDYLGDHEAARQFYQSCIELASLLKDSAAIASSTYNIGGTYADDGDLTKAFKLYDQAKELAVLIDNKDLLHRIHHAMGIDYRMMGENELAEIHCRESLRIALETQDLKPIGFGYQGLGYMFFEFGQLDSAEYYMNKALDIAIRISNDQLKENARGVLQQIYYKQGRYKEAYDTFVKLDEQEDSLYNVQNSKLVEGIKAKYHSEKQERLLAEKNLQLEAAGGDLERHRNLQIILILCVLLLAAVLFLIYRGYVLRKRANDILRSKNQEIEQHLKEIESVSANRSKWFVNVAHELRTPLTLIKGPVQKILSSKDLSTDMRADLELVNRNTLSLTNLVNEILDLSKMDNGDVSIKETTFSLDGLVSRVVSAFESRADQLGIQLKLVVNAHEQITADYDKLEKIVINLISNALKFTPYEGLIEVFVTKSPKGNLKVVVKDTGRGISSDDINHIFDRFYQSKDISKIVGGTGVGLALSKDIAEMHGGELRVTSTPGMGSTFTLILPEEIVAVDDALLPSIEELKQEVLGNVPIKSSLDVKPILLLLEDNDDMTSYITSLLEPYFNVKNVGNGKLGLEVLSKYDVKFVVSDIMMPEMGGISFLKEVKKSETWKHIPFIHLTALHDEALKKELFQIGIDDYLLKPFDSDELIIRVRNLYNNYMQRVSLSQNSEQPVSYDEKVISRLKKHVLEYIDDTHFNVLRLADAAAMSERQLYRYLKSTTGFTPLQFIQEIKLNYANDLARRKAYSSLSELSSAVGFKQAAYFSNLFEKRFGKKPGVILKS